jgi:hypothetical protein
LVGHPQKPTSYESRKTRLGNPQNTLTTQNLPK